MTRRIMIALDASPASRAALESAARLAAELSAEVFGLFIEDAEIISAAGLPGVTIVSYQGTHTEPLDAAGLMSSLRARARILRQDVERIANTYDIQWRFETARGHVSEEILRAAASSEMIALGFTSFHRGGWDAFGATALAIIDKAPCSVLLARRLPLPASRIVVLSAGSRRAQEIGRALARMTNAELAIQEPATTVALTFEQLIRLAPGHVVIDRKSLALLGVSARELGRKLRLEGLIVTASAAA
jgi:nucleotide-binding universal stress UspA family protein